MRVVNFSDGFTSTTPPTGIGSAQEDYIILNNVTNGPLFTMNHAVNKTAFADFELIRGAFHQSGSMIIAYDGAWSITFGNFSGDDMINDPILSAEQISIHIDAVSGLISYDSGDLTAGTLKLNITRVA